MAVGKDKMRLSISLSKINNRKLDKYSKQFGCTKSQLIAVALGQYLMTLDKAVSALNKLPEIEGGQLTLEQALNGMFDDDEEGENE